MLFKRKPGKMCELPAHVPVQVEWISKTNNGGMENVYIIKHVNFNKSFKKRQYIDRISDFPMQSHLSGAFSRF